MRRTHQAVDTADTLVEPARARASDRSVGGARAPIVGRRDPVAGRAAPQTPIAGPPSRAGARVLDRYLLLDRLGAGGFGVVFRAHDTLLDRPVAVKAIPLPDDADRGRAAREAQAAARLSHPSIVALHEAFVEDSTFYLVSELVHGETLASLLAADELGDDEIVEIGLALSDALLHAHGRGVVHRDIKPANVLVPSSLSRSADPAAPRADPAVVASPDRSSDSPAKLTDFGGALLTGEEGLTRTGDVLGTLAYMAPEQIEGDTVDERADLYSLALVLFEAFSGANPVRGPTPAATVRRIGLPLPPLARSRRDLPRALASALDRALDPDPACRGSLSGLRVALSDAVSRGPRCSRTVRLPSDSFAAPPRLPLSQSLSRTSLSPRAPFEAVPADHSPDPPPEESAADGPLTFARLVWLVALFAFCLFEVAASRAGLALIALCAVVPLLLLVRRPGPRFLALAFAPVLSAAGLAAVFPVLAGQPSRARSRALLGAFGYLWLRLLELPLAAVFSGPSPMFGLALPFVGPSPPGLARFDPSLGGAWHLIGPLFSLPFLLGALVWAAAAAVLPWLVRGRSALSDAAAAFLWAGAFAASVPLLLRAFPSLHLTVTALSFGGFSRSSLLAGALAALLAVFARALRGPVVQADR